ncbi:hypothetical protein RJT34_23740 [Clitoria ternatea]|uniref:Uncharacterized protein n=1 Tax=Clitoria ternatea TaxID=43366 RepID=A0AAN9FN76_CLITE
MKRPLQHPSCYAPFRLRRARRLGRASKGNTSLVLSHASRRFVLLLHCYQTPDTVIHLNNLYAFLLGFLVTLFIHALLVFDEIPVPSFRLLIDQSVL